MQLFSNLKLMSIIFIAALVLFLALLNRKPAVETQPYTAINQEPATSNYLREAEQRREQEQEQISALALQSKRQKAKENSVECQFWRQQKNEKSPPKVDEKIDEHCKL